jgi:hypothetical protein
MRLVLIIVLAAAAGLLACEKPNYGMGERCTVPGDCDLHLVCSNRDLPDGALGICVLPEALPDAAIPEPDAAVVVDASPTADASS